MWCKQEYSLNRSPTGTNARVPHENNSGNVMHEIILFLVLKVNVEDKTKELLCGQNKKGAQKQHMEGEKQI